ncbi:MAG: DNA mismatch endonuclease Vsr [Spirochaetes bacterium]|nr:DNA mismatch endonuclease Vsr [Spirochaetota bacterium]
MDTVDRKTRSRIMRSVGQRNTGPEVRLRRSLHRLGLRYRINDRSLPGTPDLVFPRFGAVIFVHGCFWHAHENCKYSREPSSRKKFWHHKFEENKRRDKRNYEALLKNGWRVLVVWECAIGKRDKSRNDKIGVIVKRWLKSKKSFDYIGND